MPWGHPTHLSRKRQGENSMLEKRESPEGDEGRLARKSRAVWLKLHCLKPSLSMCQRTRPENRPKPVSILHYVATPDIADFPEWWSC